MKLHIIGISICALMTAHVASASELDKTVRADKSTYFTLQRMELLPISVEFYEAGDTRIFIDTVKEANLAAHDLDVQFTKIYNAKRLSAGAIHELSKVLLNNGTVSDIAKAVRANYQFRD